MHRKVTVIHFFKLVELVKSASKSHECRYPGFRVGKPVTHLILHRFVHVKELDNVLICFAHPAIAARWRLPRSLAASMCATACG